MTLEFKFKENYFTFDAFSRENYMCTSLQNAIRYNANHKKDTALEGQTCCHFSFSRTNPPPRPWFVLGSRSKGIYIVLDLSPNCCSITASDQM